MSEWNSQSIESVLAEVQKRAMTDPAFRQLALADAGAALQQVTGQALAPGMKVRFVEPGNELVVPLAPSRDEGELSEGDLDNVSGGGGGTGFLCTFGC